MMEEGVSSPATLPGAAPLDSRMDLDYMDDLLWEGCWLEATDGSEFLNLSPSNSAAFFDPSFVWPGSETNNVDSTSSPSGNGNQEDKQMPELPSSGPLNEYQGRSPVSFGQNTDCVATWGNSVSEGSDVGRRLWIGPRANPGPGTSVMERLMRAVRYVKDLGKEKDVLVQIWIPISREGRRVLTTFDQPFALDSSCQSLANYREISVKYQFSADEDSKDYVGLPGRVFLGKVPEWTPDVRFFRSDEYPRVDYAYRYDVRGTLALPVFEQGSRTCLGVIEVVTTTQKIKYRPELETVCKALEAVNLRSAGVPSVQNVKAGDASYQAALPEIQEVLRSACETHGLPLAQTWVSCIQQGKEGCRHSDENYLRCVSTVDQVCCVADPGIRPFHEACSEHHLLKGQGVAGEAFMTNQPCFSSDVSSFCKTEYPLSHHARMFGLRSAVAIRLRSINTGPADYVLEFFLPMSCTDPQEQKKMLTSLSVIIQQACKTLRVVTDKELEEETVTPDFDGVKISYSEGHARHNSSRTAGPGEVQQIGSVSQKGKQNMGENSADSEQNLDENSLKGRVKCGTNPSTAEGSFSSISMGRTGEKRRTKAEKTITLQVLRQYFAGSLKDAAKSIGVCPTTLKRICRQHGITRWPSRKIKKVGHSLHKLQLVIDSVQGASAAVRIGSFYTNFPELASADLSRTSPFSTAKASDQPKASISQHEGVVFSSQVTVPKSPSSSCSQSSSSSHSCSSGTQQHASGFTVAVSEDLVPVANLGNGVLKRVKSDTEIHAPSQEEQLLLPKCQNHKSLAEQANLGNLPPLPKHGDKLSSGIDVQRVKVTYGNEKIRFRMPSNWRLEDLWREIGRRISIDDINRFNLKYLDDDSEWVLLTCDDDLEECIDVCRSSQGQTIKLSLQVSSHCHRRSLDRSAP